MLTPADQKYEVRLWNYPCAMYEPVRIVERAELNELFRLAMEARHGGAKRAENEATKGGN